MSTFSASVASGGSESWEFQVGEPFKFSLGATQQPYEIDIETKKRGTADSAYTRLQPLVDFGTITVRDTASHTYESNQADDHIRITVTNNSSAEATFHGTFSKTARDDYFVEDGREWIYSKKSNIADGIDVEGWKWIDVTNHGIANDGSEEVAEAIEDLIAEERLLIFPPGTYNFDDGNVAVPSSINNIGFVGIHATIQTTDQDEVSTAFATVTNVDNIVIKGFDFDCTATGAGRGIIGIDVNEHGEVSDIEVNGTMQSSNRPLTISLYANQANALIVGENIRLPDGAEEATAPNHTGISPRGVDGGKIELRDIYLEGWSDNGVYNDGVQMHIDGIISRDNRNSQIRTGHDGCVVEDFTVEMTESTAGRGLYAFGGTDVIYKSGTVNINTDANVPAIRVHDNHEGSVVFDSINITNTSTLEQIITISSATTPDDDDTVVFRDVVIREDMNKDNNPVSIARAGTKFVRFRYYNATGTIGTTNQVIGWADSCTFTDCVIEAPSANFGFRDSAGGDDCTIEGGSFNVNQQLVRTSSDDVRLIDVYGVSPLRDDGATRFVQNGRYITPPTLSLGGANGTVSPADVDLREYHILVDAGGSASNLTGIDAINDVGTVVYVEHAGGENVTLEHNSGASNELINRSGANEVLATNGDMAAYLFSESGKWIQISPATTQ